MPRLTLCSGDRFIRGDETLIIVEIRRSGHVIMENLSTGRRETVARIKLEQQILTGDLILARSDTPSDIPESLPPDMLSDSLISEAKRRQAYVKALDDAVGEFGDLADHLEEVTRGVAQRIKDPHPPSRATLYRWHGEWIRSGKSLTALAPRVKNKGNRAPRLTKEMERILSEFLDRHYLTTERPILSSIIETFKAHIRALNMDRSKEDKLQIPAPSTIYRFVQSMDPYEVMVRRYGKRAADNHYRKVGPGLKVEAPLDVVQMDHTKLDIQVLAPVDNLVARPWITVAFDVFTRMPIGVYIGFVPPSYESVMLCLRTAIQDKGPLLQNFKSIRRDWLCYGLPRTILLDNALEFHSDSLQDACNYLGMNMVYHPVKEPHYKGCVERFFRTLNDSFLTSLKGKTFSNILAKGEYDAVGNAVIPFDVFQEALMKWIVDAYPYKFHRGIDDFPAETWETGVRSHPVDLPENMSNTLILLCQKIPRTLTNKGIELHNTFYQSDELHALYMRHGKSVKVTVKRDPTNIGSVFVFDEENGQFIEAPCIDDDYHGLSLWQHGLIRRLILLKKKAGEEKYNVPEEMAEIWAYIENLSKGKKKRSHGGAARMTEYGQPEAQKDDQVGQNKNPKPTPVQLAIEPSSLEALLKKAISNGWDPSQDEEAA